MSALLCGGVHTKQSKAWENKTRQLSQTAHIPFFIQDFFHYLRSAINVLHAQRAQRCLQLGLQLHTAAKKQVESMILYACQYPWSARSSSTVWNTCYEFIHSSAKNTWTYLMSSFSCSDKFDISVLANTITEWYHTCAQHHTTILLGTLKWYLKNKTSSIPWCVLSYLRALTRASSRMLSATS